MCDSFNAPDLDAVHIQSIYSGFLYLLMRECYAVGKTREDEQVFLDTYKRLCMDGTVSYLAEIADGMVAGTQHEFDEQQQSIMEDLAPLCITIGNMIRTETPDTVSNSLYRSAVHDVPPPPPMFDYEPDFDQLDASAWLETYTPAKEGFEAMIDATITRATSKEIA